MSTETKILTNADAKIQPKLGVKALVQIGNAFSNRNYSDDVRDSTSVCTNIL